MFIRSIVQKLCIFKDLQKMQNCTDQVWICKIPPDYDFPIFDNLKVHTKFEYLTQRSVSVADFTHATLTFISILLIIIYCRRKPQQSNMKSGRRQPYAYEWPLILKLRINTYIWKCHQMCYLPCKLIKYFFFQIKIKIKQIGKIQCANLNPSQPYCILKQYF